MVLFFQKYEIVTHLKYLKELTVTYQTWYLPQIISWQQLRGYNCLPSGVYNVWSFDRKTYTWSSPKSSHSWNPADFTMKSSGFHEIREIWWISPMKSGADFMKSMKSSRFHEIREIWQISWNPWNLADFTHEIQWISPRYHLWNPPKIIKASVSAKTLQFDECRVGDFTLEIHQISPWNLVDFTFEIWQISPRFHLWNPPKIIKASVFSKNSSVWWMQGGGYDQGFHEIHPEIWWISPRFHLWNPPKL